VKRGELWTVAASGYASKPRPALIIQDDRFGATDSVTVVLLTTTLIDAPLLRVRIPATPTSGISHDSDAMIDKLTTVRRSALGAHIGRLTPSQLVELERALLVFLGIAG